MSWRRSAGLVALGLVWLGVAGCAESTPPSGARAIIPTDYLEKQRAKIEEMKARLKARPVSRTASRLGSNESTDDRTRRSH